MPKATRRWPISRPQISQFESGRRTCARSGWQRKPPTATSRSKPRPHARKRNRPDMAKDDRDRAEARFNKAAKSAEDAKTGKKEREATAKAVRDNMARLKALRLAKEAAEPAPATVKKPRGKSAKKS